MITKKYSTDGKTCELTFTLPADPNSESICLCGEFNNWDMSTEPLKKDKDGNLSATVILEASKEYKFRYCIDNSHWENDPDADSQVPNPFGSNDSVIKT